MRLSPFSFSGAFHPLNPILEQAPSRTEYTLAAQSRPFIPARKRGAFWLFHVTHRGIAKLGLDSKKGIKRTPEHCKEFDVLCWAVSTENGMYYSLLKQFLLSTKNNEERHLLNDFTGKVWKC